MKKIISVISIVLLFSCSKENKNVQKNTIANNEPLFSKISSNKSGVNFANIIKETPTLNYYTYKHMYIGAGVAVGDFNNDNLPDLYFVGNMSPNSLYLNKGDFKFEDITKKAGVEGNKGFYMGVTIADVNADGWLDIYLCKSGKYRNSKLKENLLYINNGDLTFTERAAEYGINDNNQSVQAAFFDYDGDNDLDLYVVNTPVNFTTAAQTFPEGVVQNNPYFRTLKGDDQFYRNDNGKYTNITQSAGIVPDGAFGLDVSIADFNGDNFPDIFVSNDFMEPDYLYINNGDGTFSEETDNYFRHLSIFSMGADASDINNDGLADLMVLDMNPEDYKRSKTTMNMMNRKMFKNFTDAGYNHLYMHNMLHLNNGMKSFNEISQFSGISNTDWSWSCIISDFDNDGFKDVHITNGIYRDVLYRDKNDVVMRKAAQKTLTTQEAFSILKQLPSQKIPNYIYKNKNGYQFEKKTQAWGMQDPSFSNGSAVADLDNDGDLDMVINNFMDTAFVYKNNAEKLGKNFIKLALKGPKNNTFGFGSKVYITTDTSQQYQEVLATRGYLSASSPKLHFGLDTVKSIKNIKVLWPDGKVNTLSNVSSNQTLTVYYSNASIPEIKEEKVKTKLITEQKNMLKPEFYHQENLFDDYKIQPLIPYKYSQLGPAIAVKDVNGDGLDDIFVGGAKQQPASIYIQNLKGEYVNKHNPDIQSDKIYEDTGALFFDADADGDVDLYVSSGGYEMVNSPELLQDRLYLNDGKGNFSKSKKLPKFQEFTASVSASDIDLDGDVDLFVGGRMVAGKYPLSPKSYVLLNEEGTFVDRTQNWFLDTQEVGLITASEWTDINGDSYPELILFGEWMAPKVYINQKGKHLKIKEHNTTNSHSGWWQTFLTYDFNNDGKKEILAGNLGLNTKFKVKEGKPFEIYASDFDGNNTIDAFLTKNIGDRKVPVRGRECSSEQIPGIQKKFPTFEEFAKADIKEILGKEINEALHLTANELKSTLFEIKKNGVLSKQTELPFQVQFSAVTALAHFDFNNDGLEDIILGVIFIIWKLKPLVLMQEQGYY
ncbi:VCBS repeat-containing protein [Polaribacter batillariae]|uniref:VCBS repeat-containing protein n=1 Tax=Polaribacter batillariae TaxID=2808900 RepID=A0ABX7SY65_9FLAO|nr:VCBS repeat-containing protein [Polaribacter batillariae]QTD38451.1 VCBS repeat-containing protein [Polaribacter batillariae]